LWKKLRLSFGRSSSVGGGVTKFSLGVADTGDGISAGTGIGGTYGGISADSLVSDGVL
jgi:hypothetical protein